jgi:hypothetical protein
MMVNFVGAPDISNPAGFVIIQEMSAVLSLFGNANVVLNK